MVNLDGWKVYGSQKFPRVAVMAIGYTNYNEIAWQTAIAKFQIAIVGFWRNWTGGGLNISQAAAQIKARNPSMMLGEYTLSEVANPATPNNNDVVAKCDTENWWLRDYLGAKVTDPLTSSDGINITSWMGTDSSGLTYSQWRAQRDYTELTSKGFDVWYQDNIVKLPNMSVADWKINGTNQSRTDVDIKAAWRDGLRRYNIASKGLSGAPSIGNMPQDLWDAEYADLFHGAFLEGWHGDYWSLYDTHGWGAAMARYGSIMANLLPPKLCITNGWGALTDYKKMRFGLCSTLLNDGYYSYTDIAVFYHSAPWYDEYDLDIGLPIDPPALPPTLWQNGCYRRRFTNGMALVNPTNKAVAVTIEPGYSYFAGTQDATRNPGTSIGSPYQVTMAANDGVILVK